MTPQQRLEGKVDLAIDEIKRLASLIDNDQKSGRPGLYQVVLSHEERLDDLEEGVREINDRRRYHAWLLTGGGAVGGGAFVLMAKSAGAKLLQMLF